MLACAVLVLFAPVANHGYTLDSGPRVRDDARVQELRVREILTLEYWHADQGQAPGGGPGLHRPLTLPWLGALAQLDGDEARERGIPRSVNAGNIALHAAGTVLRFLLFLLLLRGATHAVAWAFGAALVTAVHPVAVEAVATQVGAADGLSSALVALACLALVRRLDGGGIAWSVVHVFAVFLAASAKESALVLPAAAFLLARLGRERSWLESARAALPSALAIAGFWIARALLLGTWLPGAEDPAHAGFPLVARLASACAVVAVHDVRALAWPVSLLPYVGHQDVSPATGFGDPRALAGLAVLSAGAACIVLAWRRLPRAALGLSLAALFLLPTCNLLVPIGAVAAPRFLFLPLTGLALAVGAWGAAAKSRGARMAAAAVLAAGILAGSALTSKELPSWRSDAALAATLVARAPGSAFGWLARGASLMSAGNMDEAISAWERGAATTLPRIPGSDAVPEDVLDLVFQCSMNAGMGHAQIAATRGRSASLDEAEPHFLRARRIAERGLAQGASPGAAPRTDWKRLLGEADLWLSRLQELRARLGGRAR